VGKITGRGKPTFGIKLDNYSVYQGNNFKQDKLTQLSISKKNTGLKSAIMLGYRRIFS
jgi:hypothetical protein